MDPSSIFVQEDNFETTDVPEKGFGDKGGNGDGAEEIPQQTGPSEETIAEAKKRGWRPREEYTGRPDRFVDADEFLIRESPSRLRQEIDRTRAELEKFRREQLAISKKIMEDTQARAKAEYEAKIAQYERQRQEGFERGDYAVMTAAEKARAEAERQLQSVQTPAQTSVSPVFEDFCAKNADWYGRNEELTADADAYGIGLAEQVRAQKTRLGLPPVLTAQEEADIFARVEKRFKPVRQAQPPPVVGSARQPVTPKGKGKSVADLSPTDREILSYYQRQGLYTGKDEQKFINDVLEMY